MKGLNYEWSFWSFSRVLDQSPRNMAGIPSKLLFPSIWKMTLTSIPPKWMAPTKASPLQSFSKLAGGWLLSQVPLLSDIMWRNGSLFYAVECVIWRFWNDSLRRVCWFCFLTVVWVNLVPSHRMKLVPINLTFWMSNSPSQKQSSPSILDSFRGYPLCLTPAFHSVN